MKRKKLNKKEVETLRRLSNKVYRLYLEYCETDKDVALNYGNGSVGSQLGCAIASLDSILQEY